MAGLSITSLKIADFRRLLITRMCGLMALQAQAVIVGWQVYSLTHDPFMLGLTGLVEAVPAISCALFSGHVVDNNRPYKIYVLCFGLLVLNTLMLFLTAGGILHSADRSVLPFIFTGIFISGVARSFIMPASFSLLPQIVPRGEIPAASAWLTSGFQIGAILGPMVAGLVYGFAGATIAWLLPMLLMIVAASNFLFVSPKVKAFRAAQLREPALKSIASGLRYLKAQPALLSIMALDMFAVMFGGVVAILPMVADQLLHLGSEGLGLLRAAPAIGAVLTTLYLALSPLTRIRATQLLWAVTGFGVCMIGFGISTSFPLSLVLLAASGAFDSVSMVIRQTLMQLLTTESMRGRVASVNSMFIISSNELGAFESGTAARLLGLTPSIVAGGLVTLAVVIGTASLSPRFRKMVVNAQEVPQG
jgi:MFS family permease